MGTTHSIEKKGIKAVFNFTGRMKRKDFLKIAHYLKQDENGKIVVEANLSQRLEMLNDVASFLHNYVSFELLTDVDGMPIDKTSFFEDMFYTEALSEMVDKFLGYSFPKEEEIKN
jgi:hypothetical protein